MKVKDFKAMLDDIRDDADITFSIDSNFLAQCIIKAKEKFNGDTVYEPESEFAGLLDEEIEQTLFVPKSVDYTLSSDIIVSYGSARTKLCVRLISKKNGW